LCLGLFGITMSVKMFIPDAVVAEEAADNAGADKPRSGMDDFEAAEAGADDAAKAKDKGADGDDETVSSAFWVPYFWKRMNLMLCSLVLLAVMVIVVEFSYSPQFAAQQYLFIAGFHVLQTVIGLVLDSYVNERLLIMPLDVFMAITEILITMGAANFTDFVLAYFVGLMITIAERLYVDPNLNKLQAHIPMWKLQLHRWFKKSRRQTREQRAADELELRRVTDAIQLESEGVEPLLDSFYNYSAECAALMLTPFLQILLVLLDAAPFHTYQITEIPVTYGIRPTDLKFYTIFSFVIIPAQLAMDMFLLNTQELVHGWKLFDYISYQRYRFTVRETRWQMSSSTLDQSISPAMQSIDMMCFSAQYYFMSSVFGMSLVLVMMGIQAHLRHNFNLFGDLVTGLLVLMMWALLRVVKWLCIRFADIVGLWRRAAHEGTVDDDVARKLAIGEGNQVREGVSVAIVACRCPLMCLPCVFDSLRAGGPGGGAHGDACAQLGALPHAVPGALPTVDSAAPDGVVDAAHAAEAWGGRPTHNRVHPRRVQRSCEHGRGHARQG
jgi:hypothetical protein